MKSSLGYALIEKKSGKVVWAGVERPKLEKVTKGCWSGWQGWITYGEEGWERWNKDLGNFVLIRVKLTQVKRK